ncbi:hypothetical protein J2T41_000628 [Pseudomonas citronellolis]|uniref:hypothetical protein n=1 Tax=Pseudomonas citronellolis TaxID=53408 RepID=UPI0020A0F7ED|nr:hypothetical protein [Pseudomonas citronellolis]MCP1641034.1 hypothetical protein [Pseudomonas citronellolis]MCP1663952.1 hypothetical protein [Pseudomonas citronellolis]MCP1697130.1 hypothetical protein [Pseudomonas citronellolis]MCP1701236.1 hypothetical protein [Pseudomonas citronellolis]MCP1795739.1 hypothetical protein [Pseudomonas citronellolis]
MDIRLGIILPQHRRKSLFVDGVIETRTWGDEIIPVEKPWLAFEALPSEKFRSSSPVPSWIRDKLSLPLQAEDLEFVSMNDQCIIDYAELLQERCPLDELDKFSANDGDRGLHTQHFESGLIALLRQSECCALVFIRNDELEDFRVLPLEQLIELFRESLAAP